MLSDVEIAQHAEPSPVTEIAASLGLAEDELELFGKYKAKISLSVMDRLKDKPKAKLILVTAITPTPAGEGKTTTTVGLGDALHRMGKKACIAIREPSLGPCFGIKGGAAGGGYAQVIPMEDINLHFTGDFHAITTAHNLLAAMLDNHLHQGNDLRIDPRSVTWKRVLDMNDRALRNIVVGLGGKPNGVPRESGFGITTASEVMATLCLASDLTDLRERLGRIVVGFNLEGEPVTARDLQANGAMAAVLKDAIVPNLVQTLEHTPAFVHGGPFGNIAHGCNSVIATRMGLHLADYLVTEAGFGSDLGAEKFFDIKCRAAGFVPDAAVVVATVRALKMHGGVPKSDLDKPDMLAVERGIPNLIKHCENMRTFGLPPVVCINRFASDTDEEINYLLLRCDVHGLPAAVATHWADGGEGASELAGMVLQALERPSQFRMLYDARMRLKSKIGLISAEVYGAEGVVYTEEAERKIKQLESLGFGELPICMAKTQASLSDNPNVLGRPVGFHITVKDLKVSAGAGFVVAYTGSIMTMPGLPKRPAAERIDLDGDGKITGLF
ncbi:MAG: formate--tetrahydrofolate ligase [Armatimonadetes bacterium]|nr:formate--tetrahydrofolate ligase [Armatimonadota bacterium]